MQYSGAPNWAPMEKAAPESVGQWMWMGWKPVEVQPGDVLRLDAYKHRDWRGYVWLGPDGEAYDPMTGQRLDTAAALAAAAGVLREA